MRETEKNVCQSYSLGGFHLLTTVGIALFIVRLKKCIQKDIFTKSYDVVKFQQRKTECILQSFFYSSTIFISIHTAHYKNY